MAVVEIAASVQARVQGFSTSYATALSTSQAFYTNKILAGQVKSGSNYLVYRGFAKFDTSSLSGATITGVVLKMSCDATDNSNTDFDFQILKFDWSSYDPLSNDNREAAFDGAASASLDDNIWINTADVLSTLTHYTSGALDTSWINTSGNTYYAFRGSREGTTPSGSEYMNIYYTGELLPTLVVTYEAGGGSSAPIHLIRTGMQPGMRIGL